MRLVPREDDLRRFQFDQLLLSQGYEQVCGVDEAGRGCLAGPVVAAAVILPLDEPLPGVRDSKRLTPTQRESLFQLITSNAMSWSVGVVGWQGIDRVNIYQASAEAMRRAVRGLSLKPQVILVDGMNLKGLEFTCVKVVKGDDRSLSIAAASIIAKVIRDRLMLHYHDLYPQYNFAFNKGYATKEHIKALKKWGPSPIHRRSFRWVKVIP